jgi:hypothetical protein
MLRDDATVNAWSAEPLAGGAGETLGVWRVTGEAIVDGDLTPFTIILKGWPAPGGDGDPTAWDWPHRELRACASGVLDQLPAGIAAPRCLGEMRGIDGTIWAWMTPISTGALARWELEHFGQVARRLGQFNGAYLAGMPLPNADWLSRGWTRQWTEAARASIEQLDRYLGHPRVAQAFPPAERRAIDRLFAERHGWFDAIDALPRTFCHLDAFPRNVFLRTGPDGGLTLSLIDWSFTGIAAAGEEIVALVSSSILFGEAAGIAEETLDETVFAAYIAGLRDAGWHGDERLTRMAYTGSLAMRYLIGPLRILPPVLASGNVEPKIEAMFGISYDAFRERVDRHNAWAWGLADEFRDYLRTMGPLLPDAA